MPSTHDLLLGLERIANDFLVVAVFWHVVLAVALGAVVGRRWRPPRRLAATALAAPLASVAVLAFVAGNPFNGGLFLVLAGLVAGLGWRLPSTPVFAARSWAVALGGAAVAYGWLYPHFLDRWPAWICLVAAPTGTLPCPTLAVVIGFGLLAGGFGSRAWSLTVGLGGLLYALFGLLWLGVWIDVGLLVASLAMLAWVLELHRRAARALHPAPPAARPKRHPRGRRHATA